MNFPDSLLPASSLWFANLLAGGVLLHCIRHAPWRHLASSAMQHVWLASCVGVLLLWNIKAGVRRGLNFHLLGATLLTLMFGPRLAIIALSVVLLGTTLTGSGGWFSLGINALLMIVLPIMFTYLLYSLAHHRLPHHLFIYIFVNAFATAGLATCLVGLAATLLLAISGAYGIEFLGRNYLPYFILLAWSEAMLTGMAVTMMTAFRPAWLATFSDQRYLYRKKP
jgi:uncharacterized membrane protein